MTSLAAQDRSKARTSVETERRHLLSESIAPSTATSIIGDYIDGDRTPRAHSPIRVSKVTNERCNTLPDPEPTPQPYKGFPSEADYLQALREWAEEQKYIRHDTMLTGFYGHTTMEEYASRPRVETGLKKALRARKARKEERKAERRNTVA